MKTTETFLFRLCCFAASPCCVPSTRRAQNNSLTANPPQLLFNGTSVTQLVQITSGSAQAITVSRRSPSTNWLQVTPTSGTTPVILSVSIGSTPPTATDVGFINISSAGSFPFYRSAVFNPSSAGGISPISDQPDLIEFCLPGQQYRARDAGRYGVDHRHRHIVYSHARHQQRWKLAYGVAFLRHATQHSNGDSESNRPAGRHLHVGYCH